MRHQTVGGLTLYNMRNYRALEDIGVWFCMIYCIMGHQMVRFDCVL